MPLFWLSLAFLVGILLSSNLPLPPALWGCLALLALLFALLPPILNRFYPSRFTHPVSRLPYSLIPLLFFLGALRYQSVQPDFSDPSFIAFYNDFRAPVIVQGLVIAPPDRRDLDTYLRIRAERARLPEAAAGFPVHGLLLARVSREGDWRYGDRLQLQGMLETPPEAEDFSYREYLARQSVYSLMNSPSVTRLEVGKGNPILAAIYALKECSLAVIYRLYPDPEASLLAGIVLGEDGGIPEGLKAAFTATGTSHIIAISGFNMAIIAGLFTALFGRLLGPRRGAVAALFGIAFYTLLVGASASVVRAALMGGLSLFAVQAGRRQDGLNSLAFVAALMAVFNPQILWDIGFQLSFTATLGLVLYAGPLTQAFQRLVPARLAPEAARRLSQLVGEYFLFTLAAQVVTLPVMLYHFQSLSLISLLANPLVLPVQPAVMVLGGLAGLLGLVFLPLGQVLAYLAWPFVAYTIRMVELLGQVPEGMLTVGRASLWGVLLFYALLFAVTFVPARLQRAAAAVKPSLALVGLGILTVLIWRSALAAPDGRLHITFLDVGSGDGLLIQAPGGRVVLIDGGPSPSTLSSALGKRLPLGHRELDWLVVAASGEEQVGALPRVLGRFPPQNVLWSGPPSGSSAARSLQEAFSESVLKVTIAQPGQALDLGSGAVLRVLATGKRGSVLLLEWGSFHALLPVGIDFDLLDELQADPALRGLDALLLADSGYAPSNPPEWISKLHPQVVLLSVGAGDRQGRPDTETLAAAAGYPLLRTDRNGWIEMSTDGDQMWVEVERP